MPASASIATQGSPAFEVFFDGECPLCQREIRLLRRLDRGGHLLFTDIALPSFNAAELGLTQPTLMATIHGRLPDGTLVEGVEVFRRLYSAVGFRRLVALSRWSWVSRALDLAYTWFARNRLRWTGRCEDGSCAVPKAR